jgi:hypothetical protein
MTRICIVSGCDARYFSFLKGLLASLEPIKADKVVLDFGLSREQLQFLHDMRIRVAKFSYPHDFPVKAETEQAMPGFGAMLARPYLTECVPGYDIILWLDADLWVQEPDCIDMLVPEAARFGIAAVPEIDRGYAKFTEAFHFWNIEAQVVERVFGQALAQKMYLVPTFNSGMLAIRSDSPLWRAWRHYLQIGLLNIKTVVNAQTHTVEQIALNIALRANNFIVRPFPCTFNWLVNFGVPAYDEQRGVLIEPNPPYAALKIVHLSSLVLNKTVPLPCIFGDQLKMVPSSLDYFSIKALAGRAELKSLKAQP